MATAAAAAVAKALRRDGAWKGGGSSVLIKLINSSIPNEEEEEEEGRPAELATFENDSSVGIQRPPRHQRDDRHHDRIPHGNRDRPVLGRERDCHAGAGSRLPPPRARLMN